MSLKTVKDSKVNQISKTLQEYVDKGRPKSDGIVKYRLLNGTKNTDKDKHDGEMLYPASVTVPLKSVIFDPETSGDVEVGCVVRFDVANNPTYKKYFIQPRKGDPYFFLYGNKIADMEVYDAMELSSFNKSNPYRDTSVEPLFERVNDEAEATARSNKRNELKKCFDAIERWTYEEAKITGSMFKIPTSLPHSVIKEKLETIAEKDPATFYKMIDSEEGKVKALIALAQEKGIVAYSAHENTFTMAGSGEILASLPRVEGADPLSQFALILLSAANGATIRKNIEKILKAK